jgi:hypothetical protein
MGNQRGSSGNSGDNVKHKKPNLKHGGWKESPRPPISPTAKCRRAEYLRDWNRYMSALLFAEAEQ